MNFSIMGRRFDAKKHHKGWFKVYRFGDGILRKGGIVEIWFGNYYIEFIREKD